MRDSTNPDASYELLRVVSFHNHPLDLDFILDPRTKKSLEKSLNGSLTSENDIEITNDTQKEDSGYSSGSLESSVRMESTYE
jgi:hypothetical protein